MCLTGRSATALFWTVVAAGGAGIEYYAFVPARFTNTDNIDRTDVAADVASAAASFSSQIQSLAQPILTGERLTLTPLSDTPVRIGAWRFNGKTYIVAVNTSASRATLALATRATVARVLFEARILRVAKRRLRDSFLPFAVHIYVVG